MTSLSFPQKMLAVLILVTIVFFSLYRLTESPPFAVDQGWAVQVGANIAHLGIDGLQFAPGSIEHVSTLTSVGYPLLYALTFWFKLFGAGVLQARIMMAVYMLAFASVSFFFLRRLYGNTIAFASLAILATFPPFYSFGKSIVGEVPVLFFLTMFLLCFNWATSFPEKKRFWMILAGVSAGLCVVTKTMALAFLPVLVIGAFIAYRKRQASWKDIGIVALSATVPIAVWIMVNFQRGDTLASVADYYTNPSALTDKTATFWLNIRIIFTTMGPLYMLSLLGLWIGGIALRLKARTKIYTEESIALIFAILLFFSLLFRYLDARYLFPVQVLGILFAPYSVYSILHAIPGTWDAVKRTKIFSWGVALFCLAGLYQVAFHSYIADTYKSTDTADMSAYFGALPNSTAIFFYNAPNAVPFFHGSRYYQRIAMFEKWVLGSEFGPIIKTGNIDLVVLNGDMTKEDQKVSLDAYTQVARFSKIIVLKKKSE